MGTTSCPPTAATTTPLTIGRVGGVRLPSHAPPRCTNNAIPSQYQTSDTWNPAPGRTAHSRLQRLPTLAVLMTRLDTPLPPDCSMPQPVPRPSVTTLVQALPDPNVLEKHQHRTTASPPLLLVLNVAGWELPYPSATNTPPCPTPDYALRFGLTNEQSCPATATDATKSRGNGQVKDGHRECLWSCRSGPHHLSQRNFAIRSPKTMYAESCMT